MHTPAPRLRRVTPFQGAMPADWQSQIRGILG